MYTRAYPPRMAPVPDDYSGTAMRTKENPTGESPSPVEEITVPKAPPVEETAPIKETEEKSPPATETAACGAPVTEKSGHTPGSDFLLMALSLFLLQGEGEENDLLLLLLLLLYYE